MKTVKIIKANKGSGYFEGDVVEVSNIENISKYNEIELISEVKKEPKQVKRKTANDSKTK
ncbi:hypothetical protein [Arthrospiribacter ruber]|uniref:Uncharacterized protein n=1 Tax=Arthrospiribacter ruber TaxID=2487934 RepID=A0A951J0E9_9BACT|nr:hypothetical protein [Arthrospiribacter ruber]MBW3469082.1 hypothetical protein [Arthrospiribacter ruber]